MLLTPHHVHVDGHMAVVVSGAMHGVLEGGASRVELRVAVDQPLARSMQRAIAGAGVPIVMIAPARDLSWDLHIAAGRAIATAAADSGKRVALPTRLRHISAGSALRSRPRI